MRGQTTSAALFLLVVPGFLAEVGSQNTPLLEYLSPVTFLLGTLTYGVPLLVIRELAAARSLNAAGIAILGLAYGILNEGVLARTLTQGSGPPLFDFAGYGQAGPFQVGWTLFMVTWHALHSVLYPMLMARWLFPAAAAGPWFATGRARWVRFPMAVAMAGLYALYFLNPPAGDVGVFLIYVVATAAIVLVSLRFRSAAGSDASHVMGRPALAGLLTVVLYLGAFAAPGHIPFAWYALAVLATIALASSAIRRAGWRPVPELLRFGAGDYLAFNLLAATIAAVQGNHPIEAVAAGILFVVIFASLLRAVSRQPFGRGATAPAPAPAVTRGIA